MLLDHLVRLTTSTPPCFCNTHLVFSLRSWTPTFAWTSDRLFQRLYHHPRYGLCSKAQFSQECVVSIIVVREHSSSKQICSKLCGPKHELHSMLFQGTVNSLWDSQLVGYSDAYCLLPFSQLIKFCLILIPAYPSSCGISFSTNDASIDIHIGA